MTSESDKTDATATSFYPNVQTSSCRHITSVCCRYNSFITLQNSAACPTECFFLLRLNVAIIEIAVTNSNNFLFLAPHLVCFFSNESDVVLTFFVAAIPGMNE